MADPRDDVEDKLSLTRPFGRRRRKQAAHAEEVVDVPSGMPDPADPWTTIDTSDPAWETGPALDSGPIPGFVPPLPPTQDDLVAEEAALEEAELEAEAELEVTAEAAAAGEAEPTDPDPVEPPPEAETEPEIEPKIETEPWRQRVDLIPMLPPRAAALATGVVVGLVGAGLTALGLQGCSSVTGTASCGGPGFFLLLAIAVVMTLLGAVLLTVWQIARPGATSILAVALVAVVCLLVLVDALFSAWMFAIVPALGGIAFLGSWWLTSSFADEPT